MWTAGREGDPAQPSGTDQQHALYHHQHPMYQGHATHQLRARSQLQLTNDSQGQEQQFLLANDQFGNTVLLRQNTPTTLITTQSITGPGITGAGSVQASGPAGIHSTPLMPTSSPLPVVGMPFSQATLPAGPQTHTFGQAPSLVYYNMGTVEQVPTTWAMTPHRSNTQPETASTTADTVQSSDLTSSSSNPPPGVNPISHVDPATYEASSTSLYVKNLPADADELYLYQKFSPYGPLTSVKVKLDPDTGKCRGVGFVNYADHDSAVRGMQHMQGARTSEGRQLRINLQAPRAVRAAAAAAVTPGLAPVNSDEQAPLTSDELHTLLQGVAGMQLLQGGRSSAPIQRFATS